MPDPVDAAILGAGAAGLSLAAHLACAGWGGRVVLIDEGLPLEARSWAWWSAGDGLLDDAARAWSRVRLAGPGWEREAPLAPLAYRAIDGPELAAAVGRLVGQRPGWSRVRGTVTAVTREGDGARVAVSTADGAVEARARWVFDSVGVDDPAGGPVPWLDVGGVRVSTVRDAFDPGAVTLMDFRTDQRDGVAFLYVLPASAREALIERTVYAFPGARPGTHRPHLDAYVREVLGLEDARVTPEEDAAIPLHPGALAAVDGAVVPIGARAGLVRASTGYGFARIQRHSAALAAALVGGRDPAAASPRLRWARALDAALLRIVRDHPDGARVLFAALLRRNRPSRVLGFLEEQASPLAQARIFLSMPEFIPASMRARRRT